MLMAQRFPPLRFNHVRQTSYKVWVLIQAYYSSSACIAAAKRTFQTIDESARLCRSARMASSHSEHSPSPVRTRACMPSWKWRMVAELASFLIRQSVGAPPRTTLGRQSHVLCGHTVMEMLAHSHYQSMFSSTAAVVGGVLSRNGAPTTTPPRTATLSVRNSRSFARTSRRSSEAWLLT